MLNKFYKPMSSLLLSILCLSSGLEANNWLTPVIISSTASDMPTIAVDPSGNAVAAWQSFDGVNYRIQSATLSQGGAWTAPVTLSEEGQDAQNPRLGINSHGNGVAIWSRFDGANSVIQSSQLPSGGVWTLPEDISTPGTNADNCMLAVDRLGTVGNAIAVWQEFNGYNFIVEGATLPSGGTWSPVAEITPPGQDALAPKVAIDKLGNSTIICVRNNGNNFNIHTASQLYTQPWAPSYNLSSPGQSSHSPSVAINAAGRAMIVWSELIGSKYVIRSSFSLLGGNWSTPKNLSNPCEDAYAPEIVMDAFGNAIVVWVGFDGCNYTLQGSSMITTLGIWTLPRRISPAGYNVGYYSLCIDTLGNVLAIWDASNGSNAKIQSSNLPKIGNWSTPVNVSDTNTIAYHPNIAVDASGNAVAIWLELSDDTYIIKGATLPFGN